MSDYETAQQQLVAYAQSLVGLTAADDAYLALVAPWEVEHNDEADAEAIAKVSDCGLVAHAILQHVVDLPPQSKYIFSHAFSDVEALAKAADAFDTATKLAPPDVGDVLLFGAAGAYVAHMSTVVGKSSVADSPSLQLDRIDGGNRVSVGESNAGAETIVAVSRRLLWGSLHWVEQSTARPLIAVVRLAKLIEHYGLRQQADQS